jgi:hypothetical protein
MKKVLFLSLAVASVAGLSSCKKDYTCACTYEYLGTAYEVSYDYLESKKADAEDGCTSSQTALEDAGWESVACELSAK